MLKFFISKFYFIMLCFLCSIAIAADNTPLKPIDTSSPRATLQGFLEFADQSYQAGAGFVNSYLDSSRLYFSDEELETIKQSKQYLKSAERALDTSELAPATISESSRRLMVQLKVVLDHIDLPDINTVPDAQMMTKSEFKYWVIPNTEIRIQRVEKGERAGEYLFTSDTLRRLPEFYEKVKYLPYKSNSSVGWYKFATYSPVGVAAALYKIIPARWFLDAPDNQPERTIIFDQPIWRWCSLVVVLGGFVLIIGYCFRLNERWRDKTIAFEQWIDLLRPLSVVIVTPIVAFIIGDVLRVSAEVYQVLTLSLWTLFYLALTWFIWVTGGSIASTVIAQEHLLASSIDSQLIRLVVRLITFIASVAILIVGADQIGLPAYSVLAGLGVGGLAVALAAQQTIANLIGSLIIMFEKPFAVGDFIKLKDTEGVVESVGFRSTRIRTLYNSLVTIPSSQIVSSTIDNMELREYRQIKIDLSLTYDTPIEKIKTFIEGIKHILEAHPDTRKDNAQVFFYRFGAFSLDVLLNFFIKAPDRTTELQEQQRIFLDILRLAETMDVQFAFPTQTLHIADFVPAK